MSDQDTRDAQGSRLTCTALCQALFEANLVCRTLSQSCKRGADAPFAWRRSSGCTDEPFLQDEIT